MDYIMMERVREIFCRIVKENVRDFEPESSGELYYYLSGACDMLEAIERETGAVSEKEGEAHGRYL